MNINKFKTIRFSLIGVSLFFLLGIKAQDKLYRGDLRTPDEIKKAKGFVPYGMIPGADQTQLDYSIARHQQSTHPNTPYVSTTTDSSFAAKWITKNGFLPGGYIYVLSPTPTMVDMTSTLGKYSKFSQSEFVTLGIIPWGQIQGWHQVTYNSITREPVIGRFVPNPDYQHIFDNLKTAGPLYSFAGFPDDHIAWTKKPWSDYCRKKDDDEGACGGAPSSKTRKITEASTDNNQCSPVYCNKKISNYFLDKKRKLVFRNVNYTDLKIKLNIAYSNSEQLIIKPGKEFVLNYNKNRKTYYYGVNEDKEIFGIDLNNGKSASSHRNDYLDFTWTNNNSSITYYKQPNLPSVILINEWRDLIKSQYNKVIDANGINNNGKKMAINSFGVGKVQFIEIKKLDTNILSPNSVNFDIIKDVIRNQSKYPNYVIATAHRGFWKDYPENSIGAYQAAYDLGADMVEMDIRLTKDGQAVVLHDACLDRITTGNGRVKDHTLAEITNLKLKNRLGKVISKYSPLSLEDAMKFMKGESVQGSTADPNRKIIFSLDIKDQGENYKQALISVLKLAKNMNMLDHMIVKGGITSKELKEILNKVQVKPSSFIFTPIIFETRANVKQYVDDWVNSGIKAGELIYKKDDSAFLKKGSYSPNVSYIDYFQSKGIWKGTYSFWPDYYWNAAMGNKGINSDPSVGVQFEDQSACEYYSNDYDPGKIRSPKTNDFLDDKRGDWNWLIENGSNYIISDRPALLIEYLKAIGKRTL